MSGVYISAVIQRESRIKTMTMCSVILSVASDTNTAPRKQKVAMMDSHHKPVLFLVFIIFTGICPRWTDAEFAAISQSDRPAYAHRSGTTIAMPRHRQNCLVVCTGGGVDDTCFPNYQGIKMERAGCEVVTEDCTCYRWKFDTYYPFIYNTLTVTPVTNKPGCAHIVYTPSTEDLDSPSERDATITLRYDLDHFGPVMPSAWEYYMRQRHRDYKKSRHGKDYVGYTEYARVQSKDICARNEDRVNTSMIHYACERTHTLKFQLVPLRIESSSYEQDGSIAGPIILFIVFTALAFGIRRVSVSHHSTLL